MKTIFITGTSSGVGKAPAKFFREKGWYVIATMRHPEREKELAELDNVTSLFFNKNESLCVTLNQMLRKQDESVSMKNKLFLLVLVLMNLSLSAQVMMPAMQGVQYRRSASANTSVALGDNGTSQFATVTSDFSSAAPMTEYGICWSTSTNPTTSSSRESYGSGTGTYNKVSTLANLRAVTTYYVRPYITTSTGTIYGNEVIVTTVPTYYLTNDVQTYIVPAGVTKIRIECWGAQGGAASGGDWTATGGYGAYVKGDLGVTPGQTLYVLVGGRPFNGGGNNIIPGGGASDVRTNAGDLWSRLIVAGGGGSAPHWNGKGGDGGIATGGTGESSSVFNSNGRGGYGGTQNSGGAGGTGTTGNGTAGSFGQGGIGYYNNTTWAGMSTDGGGGWYGGGGGGASGYGTYAGNGKPYPEGGGGGGGSSYTGGVTNASGIAGNNGNPGSYNLANGKVKITVIP